MEPRKKAAAKQGQNMLRVKSAILNLQFGQLSEEMAGIY